MSKGKSWELLGNTVLSIDMFYSIDYYAMTIPIRSPIGDFGHETLLATIKAFISFFDFQPEYYELPGSWGIEAGTRPYSTRLRHSVTDVCLSVGNANAHIYVEFAGKACNNYDAKGELDDIITRSVLRVSRIDFAVDIITKVDPREFSAQRKNKSFKSSGEKRSPSGRTNYVGGRTSERMARVYRYEPPHPRSQYLRVEAEYKGSAGKAAAKHYLEVGLQRASLDAHSAFGWSHSDWTPEDESSGKIPYKTYRPENASTVRWLYGDVVTALLKAVEKGLVDFDEWLEFVREGLKDKI